jgi:hypothetical protein
MKATFFLFSKDSVRDLLLFISSDYLWSLAGQPDCGPVASADPNHHICIRVSQLPNGSLTSRPSRDDEKR